MCMLCLSLLNGILDLPSEKTNLNFFVRKYNYADILFLFSG